MPVKCWMNSSPLLMRPAPAPTLTIDKRSKRPRHFDPSLNGESSMPHIAAPLLEFRKVFEDAFQCELANTGKQYLANKQFPKGGICQ